MQLLLDELVFRVEWCGPGQLTVASQTPLKRERKEHSKNLSSILECTFFVGWCVKNVGQAIIRHANFFSFYDFFLDISRKQTMRERLLTIGPRGAYSLATVVECVASPSMCRIPTTVK